MKKDRVMTRLKIALALIFWLTLGWVGLAEVGWSQKGQPAYPKSGHYEGSKSYPKAGEYGKKSGAKPASTTEPAPKKKASKSATTDTATSTSAPKASPGNGQYTKNISVAEPTAEQQDNSGADPVEDFYEPVSPLLPVTDSQGRQYDSGILGDPAPSVTHQVTDAVQNQETTAEVAPSSEPVKTSSSSGKRLSVPYTPKNVRVVTGVPGYLQNMSSLNNAFNDSNLSWITPRYFLDSQSRSLYIEKFAKIHVRYDVRPVRGSGLLLWAFHIPELPGEGDQAEKVWYLEGANGIRTIDMRELRTGIYRFCAAASDEVGNLVAKPYLDNFFVYYGGMEANVDYKDRMRVLRGDQTKPQGFSALEPFKVDTSMPLFKIVPSTCVLKPGEKIELSIDTVQAGRENAIRRVHSRYNLPEGDKAQERTPLVAPRKSFKWGMEGKGKLEVTGQRTAVYYAPSMDNTGARIYCQEKDDKNVMTATIYVTTLPIGELPAELR